MPRPKGSKNKRTIDTVQMVKQPIVYQNKFMIITAEESSLISKLEANIPDNTILSITPLITNTREYKLLIHFK